MSNAKSDFLIVFWSPFSPLRGQFFAIFFLATKKKKKKKKKMGLARIYRQAANVSPHTYAHAGL